MSNDTFAHAAMETHSLIYQKENATIIEIDVPWTINEAARNYFTISEGSQTSIEECIAYIIDYIGEVYHVYSGAYNQRFESIELIPQDHGHSYLFRLTYDQLNLETIRIDNQLLEIIESTKIRHHTRILDDQGGESFMNSSVYNAESFWKEPYWIMICLIGLASLGGIIYLNWKKRSKLDQ